MHKVSKKKQYNQKQNDICTMKLVHPIIRPINN